MKHYYELGSTLEDPDNKTFIPKDEGNANYAAILKEISDGKAEIVTKPTVLTDYLIDAINWKLNTNDIVYKTVTYSSTECELMGIQADNYELLLANQNALKNTPSNAKLLIKGAKRGSKLNKNDLVEIKELILKRDQANNLKGEELKDKLASNTLTEQDLADWENE